VTAEAEMSPTLAAVIINFNGAEKLDKTIAALQAQTVPVAEIIVVDNCSTDGSLQHIVRGIDAPRVITI
jgi:glycosyltransferase involved in cell wall biosynthesis